MIMHWHKLVEVVSDCTIHNNILLAIFMPKIIRVGGNLTKLCPERFWLFFWHGVFRKTDLVFNCEVKYELLFKNVLCSRNNGYAISTPTRDQYRSDGIGNLSTFTKFVLHIIHSQMLLFIWQTRAATVPTA